MASMSNLLFRASLDGSFLSDLRNNHVGAWRQMELALDHGETEVAVEDHRPVIGCKVSTMVPYLPAGEIAPDESFVERHTHACVEVVVLHVVPVLARGSEQQGPWIDDGHTPISQRFRVASHLPVILFGKIVEVPVLGAEDGGDRPDSRVRLQSDDPAYAGVHQDPLLGWPILSLRGPSTFG